LENQPLISIIIPALNEEKLIKKTLSQFTPDIKQTYNIEIIVSDGGSKDKTLDELTNTVDKIVLNESGQKQNISIGRNLGAKQAKGKYLYFLNADTLLENVNMFFSRTKDEFNDNNTAALTCRFYVFPDDIRLSDKIFHTLYNNYVRLLNFIGMGMGRGECHIVRADVFWKINGYNESLAAGEDYDLYRRIKKSKLGKIKFLNDIIVYESPRRFRKYGYLKVFGEWTKNSLSVFFKNKSASKVWEEVR
jgi:glycosyltransferase involved in cell wall biosynthesis